MRQLNNTPATAQDLQSKIDRLESELYDNATLSLERVLMLEAVINDTIHALNEYRHVFPENFKKQLAHALALANYWQWILFNPCTMTLQNWRAKHEPI